MKLQGFKSSGAVTKLNNFFVSERFMAVCVVAACLVTAFRLEVLGVVLFAFAASVILVVCEDVLAAALPFMLVSSFTIKCYNSFNTFIKFWWLGIFAIGALIFHAVAYAHGPLKKGMAFRGLLIWAVAITLGGVGAMSPRDYFNPVSLFYVLGLGFGMLLAYLYILNTLPCERNYKLSDRFAKIMAFAAVFCCFMVLEHYAQSYHLLLNNIHLLAFQWRNNVSTLLMFTMPFVFYLATKRYLYLPLGILCYGCILLSGSRGGAIFGGIEFLLCMAAVIYLSPKRRPLYIGACVVLLACLLIFSRELIAFFKSLLDRLVISDAEVRVGLFARAVEDFRSNPLFGRGLGYFGNIDVHSPPKFALCWYHSLPFQIVGSFGIAGALSFIYLTYVRCYVLLRRLTRSSVMMFISFFGIEMMSLVNPGEFCPVPYGVLIVIFLALAEQKIALAQADNNIADEKNSSRK